MTPASLTTPELLQSEPAAIFTSGVEPPSETVVAPLVATVPDPVINEAWVTKVSVPEKVRVALAPGARMALLSDTVPPTVALEPRAEKVPPPRTMTPPLLVLNPPPRTPPPSNSSDPLLASTMPVALLVRTARMWLVPVPPVLARIPSLVRLATVPKLPPTVIPASSVVRLNVPEVALSIVPASPLTTPI